LASDINKKVLMKILVTGGTGYIGSHTSIELINSGFEVIIIDNLTNSKIEVVDRIENVTGIRPHFEKVEMCNINELESVFEKYQGITAAIHFAAVLQVGESVEKPLMYYQNNLLSQINLLKCMQKYAVHNLVFSSSCTVYGTPDKLPVDENARVKKAESPYGHTKQVGEEILEHSVKAFNLNNISLRYFNPIGAHQSGLLGEVPHGVPQHLVPYITQTAFGIRSHINVFGGDYDTVDGTCIRDYIHVVDIAKAHVIAIKRLIEKKNKSNYEIFNCGTGTGYSVLQMIAAFEKSTGIKIPYKIIERRAGDVVAVYADTKLANQELGWKAELGVEEMMRTAWNWEKSIQNQQSH